jgi:hypothetical protein
MILSHVCATEYSVSAIKQHFRPNTPTTPPSHGYSDIRGVSPFANRPPASSADVQPPILYPFPTEPLRSSVAVAAEPVMGAEVWGGMPAGMEPVYAGVAIPVGGLFTYQPSNNQHLGAQINEMEK